MKNRKICKHWRLRSSDQLVSAEGGFRLLSMAPWKNFAPSPWISFCRRPCSIQAL